MNADYSVQVHDPRHDPDEVIAERVDVMNRLDAEVLPDDPPTPAEQVIASIRALPERHRIWVFSARDAAGRLAGFARTGTDPEHDDNPDCLEVYLTVDAAHRRRGVGRLLLGEITNLARSETRPRIFGNTTDRVPAGGAFAAAVGAAPKSALHINHLRIEDVDRDLMKSWDADGPSRAPDYELIAFDGAVPDDLLDAFADLILVMNTAPRDDLVLNDFTMTPAQLREWEREREAGGDEAWTLVARHCPTGELVGFHDVHWNASSPAAVWVGATGVKPEHRGHALGKWLKAAMTLRIIEERAQVTSVRTGNNDSNDAMLGINRAMGYRPLFAVTTWELVLDG
ncbi:MAG TPA: GNAT family N-acetyltransferase [Acidimicrobiia bacterium]|nr:GNAT family N-acetyltransferase [Acidimicrobiia bacterium]